MPLSRQHRQGSRRPVSGSSRVRKRVEPIALGIEEVQAMKDTLRHLREILYAVPDAKWQPAGMRLGILCTTNR